MMAVCLAVTALLFFRFIVGSAAATPAEIIDVSLPCGLTAAGVHTVTGVASAETVTLDTGETVHLSGIVAPRKPLALHTVKIWRAEQAAIQALKSLVLNKPVVVAHHGPPKKDRYGRTRAHLLLRAATGLTWVQRHLVALGHARPWSQDVESQCLKDLLVAERLARRSQQGLWRDPYYQVYELRAEAAASERELLKRRHQFQIVQGRIQDVAVVRGMIYLNFGGNWRTDFTAALTKTAVSASGATLDQVKVLKGRRVQVRGWIERRNGPYIQLTGFSDIEILGAQGTAVPSASPESLSGSE
jgi:endonuclease YncB( thermonuclease family)